jgi:Type II CAAX prenyl endopeptidase Rce1-like
VWRRSRLPIRRGHSPVGDAPRSYWAVTRRPLPCLLFVGPLLAAYELGVYYVGGSHADAWRSGADAWMRHGLSALGLTDQWFPPFCLAIALLVWQSAQARHWRFPPIALCGMAIESVVLAVALVGMSKLVDLGLESLERGPTTVLQAGPGANEQPLALLIGYLGAGVYEEALFRLLLVPLLYALLRLSQAPKVLASTLAVTASALLFSLAHHAGMPGEAFTWFAFIFRWMAGVYFAWVFVLRGFGVAVGTHTAYDILVGAVDWHL